MRLTFLILCALVAQFVMTAPSSADGAFDIRSADRPAYSQTLAPTNLAGFRSQGGLILDVRLEEDFRADQTMTPGAKRMDPAKLDSWLADIKGRSVAVYCVKGGWVSQKVANHLASQGIVAFSVAGGLRGYQAEVGTH